MAVLPGTSTFIYENGVLIYGLNHEIHIRDIHRDAASEKVIDTNAIWKKIKPSTEPDGLVLLYYYSDLLVFRAQIVGIWRLIILDLYQKRVKLLTDLPKTETLIVRHNGLHLFVMYFSEHYDDHWVIRKFDLIQETEIGQPIILEDFGGDTRRGVCFEIFGDKLHGVSSYATTMDLDGDRSFYKWICIAPDSKLRRITAKKIFRRYHDLHEGALIDAICLSLQVDESTGTPMILECRHETRDLEERSCRTYYGENLPSSEEFKDYKQELHFPLLGPTRDELRAYRNDKLVHPEYLSQFCEGPRFSHINTPHSIYNLSAQTFIDLINDPMSNSKAATPDKRYRLRFNSHKCTKSDKKHVSTQLWPSDDNMRLMNPFGTSRENQVIHARADERSIIYSLSNGKRKAIVLISFDPKIRFPYADHERGDILDEWVRITLVTRLRRVWDRVVKESSTD